MIILILFSLTIHGKVIDVYKTPLPYASVVVVNTHIGTSTNGNGEFVLYIPNSLRTIKLKVSYLGYKSKIVQVKRRAKFIKIVLEPEAIKEKPVVVRGEYSVTQTEGLTISKYKFSMMDIYTTPGAAADLFYSMKTIPAFSGNPDVATLSIRGGSPDETLIMLNGVPFEHPFIYSISSEGGLFSVIPTSSIGQVEAFAGILPPSYGGKASGGVILETIKTNEFSMATLNLITGGASLSIVNKTIGGIWTRFSSYKIMAKLNGIDTKYSIYPYYGSIFWVQSFKANDLQIKPFFLYSYNKSEISLEDLGYESYLSIEKNYFGGINFQFFRPPILSQTAIGGNFVANNNALSGEFDMDMRDKVFSIRTAFTYYVDIDKFFTFGGDFSKKAKRFKGTYDDEQFKSSKSYQLKSLFFEYQLAKEKLKLVSGVWSGFYKKWMIDPRILGELDLPLFAVKFGIGKMSQIKEGEKSITWLRADHLNFELERSLNNWILRGSVFYKKYSNKSISYGVEGLIKRGNFQAGIGWMRARDRDGKPLDYERPWRISTYNTWRLFNWGVGIKLDYASGKPYTPVVDVESDSTPVWGEKNSARMPDIFRVDLRILRVVRLWSGLNGFFFLEIYNIFNHKNVSGYAYSRDYRRKQPIKYFERMFVAGISLSL